MSPSVSQGYNEARHLNTAHLLKSRFISGSRGEGGAAQHEAGGPHQAADQGAQERPGRPREREKTQKSSK